MSQRESVWVTGGPATVESLDVPKGRWRGALSGALDCFDCLDRPDCLCRCRGYLHSVEDERLGSAPAGRCSEAKCLRGIGEAGGDLEMARIGPSRMQAVYAQVGGNIPRARASPCRQRKRMVDFRSTIPVLPDSVKGML